MICNFVDPLNISYDLLNSMTIISVIMYQAIKYAQYARKQAEELLKMYQDDLELFKKI